LGPLFGPIDVPNPLAGRKVLVIASRIPLEDLGSRDLKELIATKSVNLKILVSPQ